MFGTDPWHHHRTLRRATIIGVSAFFLISAPIVLKRIDMSLRALQVLFFGWMIFVLTMMALTYRVRCPRCGHKFLFLAGAVGERGDYPFPSAESLGGLSAADVHDD
jgi:hypothetical protein